MSTNPTISVVMPGFNAERFVGAAIESILNQTFKDFELIFINDGSTDKTEEVVLSYKDPRIVYLKNEGNKGLAYSFNKGIALAKGAYIARMDTDDLSLPDRFHKQYTYLKAHPRIGILGSSMYQINEKGEKTALLRRDPSHLSIKWSSLFSTPLYHPTIMGKAEIFKSHHYNEGLTNSEDYELWSRLLFNTNIIFANIKRPLLLYRAYASSFTQTINLDKRITSAHNTISNIEHYLRLTEKEKRLLTLLRQERKLSPLSLMSIWFVYLKAAFKFINKEHVQFREVLRIHWRLIELKIFLLKHFVKHL